MLFARAPVTVLGILMWPGTQVAVLSDRAAGRGRSMSLLLARYRLLADRAAAEGEPRARGRRPRNARRRPFDRRSDEVGTLARDFDAMAERIQALVTAKETLLRDVSHELRSPLARIRMALALAQRRAARPRSPISRASSARPSGSTRLVGQVMTLTRLRTTDAPRRDIVRLDTLVGEVVDDARFEYPETHGRILRATREVSLRGDAGRA